ncbi:hypothetical protein BDR26DRAFT_877145 [Obelidium mucronatum]|nr:hypothetical protein BDR26DRAFT_877145 [Obelidium mucronatum]
MADKDTPPETLAVEAIPPTVISSTKSPPAAKPSSVGKTAPTESLDSPLTSPKKRSRQLRNIPPPLHLRKPADGVMLPAICHHGKRRSQCIDCYDEGTGGSTICKHRRQRYSCRACFDEGIPTNSLCEHRHIRKKCKLCAVLPGNGPQLLQSHINKRQPKKQRIDASVDPDATDTDDQTPRSSTDARVHHKPFTLSSHPHHAFSMPAQGNWHPNGSSTLVFRPQPHFYLNPSSAPFQYQHPPSAPIFEFRPPVLTRSLTVIAKTEESTDSESELAPGNNPPIEIPEQGRAAAQMSTQPAQKGSPLPAFPISNTGTPQPSASSSPKQQSHVMTGDTCDASQLKQTNKYGPPGFVYIYPPYGNVSKGYPVDHHHHHLQQYHHFQEQQRRHHYHQHVQHQHHLQNRQQQHPMYFMTAPHGFHAPFVNYHPQIGYPNHQGYQWFDANRSNQFQSPPISPWMQKKMANTSAAAGADTEGIVHGFTGLGDESNVIAVGEMDPIGLLIQAAERR